MSFSVWAVVCLGVPTAGADDCPQTADEIATDRPDVTNSSLVVPLGSLQSENGINLTTQNSTATVDASNTRLRWGVARCVELLVDLPTYVAAVRGSTGSGSTDVVPAVKWQISPVPDKIDLSAVVGAALPTGSTRIAGPGVQPYVQFPWSWEVRDGWSVNGMVTEFIRPSDPADRLVTQTTFVIEKKIRGKTSLFVEYVGDYPDHSGPTQLINSGGMYRLTPTQQIDFHVAFGLNHKAPDFIVGAGYSFRLDRRTAGDR